MAQVLFLPAAMTLTLVRLKKQASPPPAHTLTGLVLGSDALKFPSWPQEFDPQHWTPPAVVRAQVCAPPGAMVDTLLLRPVTSTGVARTSVVPSPSWPKLFLPQHWTPPAVVRAQVCQLPAAMAVTPLVRPVTSAGMARASVVPSPSWLKKLSPQHLTAPPVKAQVWKAPAAMAVTPLLRPVTSTGALLSSFVPFPS
jgi:hypothetical protein